MEIKPDRILSCLFANFVIVQNKRDPLCRGISCFLIDSSFVYYWTQPSLIPRDPKRGDRFENISFFGDKKQFIKEVDVLAAEIKKLGLNWTMGSRENWNDYSATDCIVAVRRSNSATEGNPDTPTKIPRP